MTSARPWNRTLLQMSEMLLEERQMVLLDGIENAGAQHWHSMQAEMFVDVKSVLCIYTLATVKSRAVSEIQGVRILHPCPAFVALCASVPVHLFFLVYR